MLIFRKIYTILILILFLSNCAHFTNHGQFYLNAKKAYARGDYDQTSMHCISSLRDNINYKPSYELLIIAFPKTINFHHKKIERSINSRDYFKWDIVVNELEILINLVDDIESLNFQAIINKSNIRNYYEEIQEAKLNAAETHYQYGKSKMNTEDKDELRIAAIEFKKSLGYISDY